jgi:hypothetical protein
MNVLPRNLLQPNLIAQYLPSILKGVVTTFEIALAVWSPGSGARPRARRSSAAFQIKPLNALIVVFVDNVPRAAAAGDRADRLFRPANVG